MLDDIDRERNLECAAKYGVTTLVLFCSSLEGKEAHDIDLGVRGIAPELFLTFYGELLRKLSRPVDIVDLSSQSRFNDLVESRGVKIYG